MFPHIENFFPGDYVDQVMASVVDDAPMKARIRKDLIVHMEDACTRESIDEVLGNMGRPEDVAREFMENIYENKDEIISRLIHEHVKAHKLADKCFEFRSRVQIGGIPLVHIKYGRRFTSRMEVAKGIVAIGDIAIGVIALGRIFIGLLSLGAFALGLLSLGGFARGTVAIGGKAVGEHIISKTADTPYSLGYVPKEQIYSLIKTVYPQLSDWVIKIFTLFN